MANEGLKRTLMMVINEKSLERFKNSGYRTIHLLGPLYLIRNYSVNAKRVSLYGLVWVKKNKE